MGTNYYLKTVQKDPCPTCERPHEQESLHIGKSSGGWCFSLHVMPEQDIHDLDDWIKRWSVPGFYIENEYGDSVTNALMLSYITERGRDEQINFDSPFCSYSNADEFYRRNGAEPGPNNLARHKLSERCIKHGAGTWDCMVGEFS